jgi:UDP-N-acetylmuramate: L-alanyl-gamma-D-glutamyl-meso-diaminopimelate ligase
MQPSRKCSATRIGKPKEKGEDVGRLPDEIPKKVHMIAVCGTGMGALALLFRERGVEVSGSDVQAYPPMGDLLRRAGVSLSLGYGPENLPDDVDYVVVGNAVSRDNPEVEALLARGLPYGSFPETLAHFFLASRYPIVVTGTHGKTTSTSLLAWLLECSGNSPGFLVGGEPKNFGSSSRLGQGEYFVVEGDEYDSAFFDKGPKFLHYRPRAALFTSLEFDHADIYPDLASIREQFVRFVDLLPADGLVMVCEEYPDAVDIAGRAACRVETYGYGKGADWVGVLREGKDGSTTMEVSHGDQPKGTFSLPLPGRHNGLNLLGSLALLSHLGVRIDGLTRCVETFAGIRRRQEVAGETRGVLLIDDFAHHPTAVRETVAAVRSRYPGRRVLTVFEPRTNTSRRNLFQGEYAEAFALADVAICTPVYRPDTVTAGERFRPDLWARDLRGRGVEAYAYEETEALVRGLTEMCRPGDLVLFMSSGSLAELIDTLKGELDRRED